MSQAKLSTLLVAKDLTRGVFRGFTRSLNIAKKAVFNFKTGLVALAGIAGLGILTQRTLESVDANKKMADRIGLTTKQLGGFELAAALAGEKISTVQKTLEKMEKNLGEAEQGIGTARYALEALNLSVDELNRLSPDERFKRLSDEVAGLATQQEKATIAFQLFGKGGMAMIQVLELGSEALTQMQEDAIKFGLVLNAEASASIEKFNDDFFLLKTIGAGVFRTFLVGLIPAMTKMVEIATKFALQFSENGGPQRAAQKLLEIFVKLSHGIVSGYEGILKMSHAIGMMINNIPDWLVGEEPIKEGFFMAIEKGQKDVAKLRSGIDRVGEAAKNLLNTTKSENELSQAIGLEAMTKEGVNSVNAFDKLASKVNDFRNSALNHAAAFTTSFGKAFENVIMGTKRVGEAFKDLGRQILAALVNLFVQKMILGPILSPFQTFFEGLIPTPQALGGPVKAGGTFLVGERGPELLTLGRMGGTITPNNQLGGTNQTINITTGVQSTVRAEILSLLPAIAQASQGQIIDNRMRGAEV
jgi:hypothetical protein